MTEIIPEAKQSQPVAASSSSDQKGAATAVKAKSSSKLLLFDTQIHSLPLFQSLEITEEKIGFHVGEKLFLSTNGTDGHISLNTESVEFSNVPCLELSVKRESLAAIVATVDKAASEKLLEETLDLKWKINLPDHAVSLELVRVNHLREDIFVVRYLQHKRINDTIGVTEEAFQKLVQEYKETFKLNDSNLVELLFLDALDGVTSSEKLTAVLLKKESEPVIVDEETEKKKKQLEMVVEMNLKDFVGEKILHLPVFKKETGFFNYSQYQVFDISTQTFSAPVDIPKPNYYI